MIIWNYWQKIYMSSGLRKWIPVPMLSPKAAANAAALPRLVALICIAICRKTEKEATYKPKCLGGVKPLLILSISS